MSNNKRENCCDNLKQTISRSDKKLFGDVISEKFVVTGMDCADEVLSIQSSLAVPGVGNVNVNLMSSQVIVEHDSSITRSKIVSLINGSGVKVKDNLTANSFYEDNKSRVILVSISGLFLSIGLVINWLFEIKTEILFLLFLVSTLTGGSLIFPKALKAIKQKSLDMNVLMTLAATGAFFIREYSEGAAVVFLFSLAEMLEAFSVAKARKAIQEVLSITPQMANVDKNETIVPTLVEQVKLGQLVVVKAGERVPLDGIVEKGSSLVNQAPLTGESQPIEKNVGDSLFAGTINESGTLKIRVSQIFTDSKIANVIRLVEEAQNRKAPSQMFVDKFSKIYTPVVTIIALLVAMVPPLYLGWDWNQWFYRSLVFLVIACPCALVIATPVSIVSALTALAKIGVLVKGGVHLESVGKIRAIAMDKTGTITEGEPKVVSMKIFNKGNESDVVTIMHSLERESTHPLARAVINFSKSKGLNFKEVHDFKVIQGKGIEGRIGEHFYFAGNHKMAHEFGVCTPLVEEYLSAIESQAQSVLIIGRKPHLKYNGEILGIFGLSDEPRENVADAISNLHKVGIQEIVMLSGDNQRTASAIAHRVGIDIAKGDLLPEHKVTEVQKLLDQHIYVGMIGDGINDAPALAQATVGIAMGAIGTDAAIETADVALMSDDLNQLSKAIEHGRKTLRIIRFNIGFALATKTFFLVLGIVGISSLWLAVTADLGATLLVIANSLRLLKVK